MLKFLRQSSAYLCTLCLLATHFAQAGTLNLPDSPLNLISAVEPNVMFIIDDSGSMDWEVLIANADQGIANGALSGYYVLPSPNNGFDLDGTLNGYFAYTISDEDSMVAQGVSGLGIWRLKNSDFNLLYYDPKKTYRPWAGQNALGSPLYLDANPTAAWLDPNQPNLGTFDLTSSVSFTNHSHHLNSDYPETLHPATYYAWQDADNDGVVDAGDSAIKVEITPSTTSYFSGEARSDCIAAPICTYTEEIQNFANWYVYHRKRNYAARASLGEIIQNTSGIKMGLYLFNDGIQQIPLSLDVASNKTTLFGNVYNTTFNCIAGNCPGTPARKALASVGEYFAQINSPIASEANGGRCQQNFNIMLTDGYRNGELTAVQNNLIGNEDGDDNTDFDGGHYADVYAQTLADIAMYLYENDLQPTISNDVPEISAEDNAPHQHMNTYTMAFGASGLLDPFGTITPSDATDTDPSNPLFVWPQVLPLTASTIDDLWHAAYNGRGAYLNTMQSGGVSQAFEQMVSSVLDRISSTSSVALNSAALGADTLLFQSRFDSADWHGELWAYPINTDGTLGNIVWDANCKLSGGYCSASNHSENAQDWDTGRVILTSTPPDNSTGQGVAFRWPNNPAAPNQDEISLQQITALKTNPIDGTQDDNATGMNRLNFIRGANISGMRARESLLGDIVDSQPIYVGRPSFAYPDSLETSAYADFAAAKANRTPVIYVGANDGMLHGFNATASETNAGKEILAYVPSKVYANLPALSHAHYGGLVGHRFYVNGSPSVGDVHVNGAWQTLLVGSLGKGGQGIFALDITNPADFSESNASNIVQWEFTDALDSDLGYTYGRPAIIRLANGKWAVAIGNGYNNTAADDQTSSTGNAVIYLLDAEDGSLIRKFNTQTGMSEDPAGIDRPNGIATLSPVDVNNDHITDYIYAPDLLGNVWKLDVRASSASSWGFAFGSSTSPKPFFRAQNAANENQSITTALDVAMHPASSGQMLYFGTGKYLEPSDVGQSHYPTQSFYGVWDRNSSNWNEITRNHLLQQSIVEETTHDNGADVRLTSDHSMQWYSGSGTPANAATQGYLGWYLDLYNTQSGNTANKGERVVADPVLRSDRIVFSAMSPSSDPCDLGGESWLMELNSASGGRVQIPTFDLNDDGVFTTADNQTVTGGGSTVVGGIKSEVGILTTPVILQNNNTNYAGEGNANSASELKFISGSSGEIQTVLESRPISHVGRQSWRQIQ